MSEYQFWPAPAKLNLFLQITGKREDGYHNLQTVFQFLDKGDRLRFVVRDDGKFIRKTDNEGVKPEDDLVIKAAQSLQDATQTSKGADIYLQKILPAGQYLPSALSAREL
jgi:4-diphosphocytidyl-2-C-methyl-D-erythritol kinase